jgi:hypothetical protein
MIIPNLSILLQHSLATLLLQFLFRLNITCFPDFSIPVAAFPLPLPTVSVQLPCSFELAWRPFTSLPESALVLPLPAFSLLFPVPKDW